MRRTQSTSVTTPSGGVHTSIAMQVRGVHNSIAMLVRGVHNSIAMQVRVCSYFYSYAGQGVFILLLAMQVRGV